MPSFARAAVAAIALALVGALIAPTTTAAEPTLQRGQGRIVTAPGLVATFTANQATIGVQRPATIRFTPKDRTKANSRATLTFPVGRITNTGQIVFAGAMTIKTKDQQVTLRNITVDLEAKAVYVSVSEFFGLTIEAFRIANTPTIRTIGNTTIVRNAQLVVSPQAGQQLSSAIGDPNFGAGAQLGRASLQFTQGR
jgi:hypothetical protein